MDEVKKKIKNKTTKMHVEFNKICIFADDLEIVAIQILKKSGTKHKYQEKGIGTNRITY